MAGTRLFRYAVAMLMNRLKANFPDGNAILQTCFNSQKGKRSAPFENYCAIRVSEALLRSNVQLHGLPRKERCWSHGGSSHALRAQGLANWLDRSSEPRIGRGIDVVPRQFQKSLDGKTGIIFFRDYWMRSRDRAGSPTGDHIDLWLGDRLTGNPMWIREVLEFFGSVSDLNRAAKVRFWPIA